MEHDTRLHPSSRAFTLVELLTVIAIIGVLATLLFSALGSAKRKGRQVRCTGNLHQISLALNMYLDDHERRPNTFDPLVRERYLSAPGVLLCPEDKTGNWGALVSESASMFSSVSAPPLTGDDASAGAASDALTMVAPVVEAPPAGRPEEGAASLPFSYLNPLPWGDEAWNQLQRAGSSAGLATCQWHGLGRPNPDGKSIRDFVGLVLRAQRDGAVVRRKIFWESTANKTGDAESFSASRVAVHASPEQDVWPLLSDEPKP